MNEQEGIYYLPASSECVTAWLSADEHGEIRLRVSEEGYSYSRNEYEIEPKLGNLPRVFRFRDGGRLETSDSSLVRALENGREGGGLLRLVSWMEDRWPMAVASIAGMALFVFVFLEYAMPAIANHLAHEVPQAVRERISEESLDSFQRMNVLGEKITEGEDFELASRAFEEALAMVAGDLSPEYNYELHIHAAPAIGPNAFALPSGAIVATREFLELCETEEQVMAVFLHEIAHVEEQHGLRSVLQNTGVFLILSIALGDLSSMGGLLSSVPSLALESRYSQAFEIEADTFAGRQLIESGRSAAAMKEILVLLHRGSEGGEMLELISSHPSLGKRIDNLEAIEAAELLGAP